MKKLLLATSALAFAGSAFAADVSGYATQGYLDDKHDAAYGDYEKTGVKEKKDKSLYNESEVYVSGSKTASNGLTFGATYTIGLSNSYAKSMGDSGASPATSVNAGKMYNKVNGFVSSSFGRLDMGKHNGAAESHGAHSTYVGNGVANNTDMGVTDGDNENGITYSSPEFNGISGAYSMDPMKDSFSSWGIKYENTISGIGLAVAFGMETPAKDEDDVHKDRERKANNAFGVKVSKGAFAGSFSMGTKSKNNVSAKAEDDEKSMRFGVAYSAGKVSVGISQNEAKTGDDKETAMLVTASYTVATGLQAYIDYHTTKDKDSKKTTTTLIGTKISF